MNAFWVIVAIASLLTMIRVGGSEEARATVHSIGVHGIRIVYWAPVVLLTKCSEMVVLALGITVRLWTVLFGASPPTHPDNEGGTNARSSDRSPVQ